MTIIDPKPVDMAFMYIPVADLSEESSQIFLTHDICNAIGYLPFVSVIAGIARIIFSLIAMQKFEHDAFKEFCIYNIVRGILEMTMLAGLALAVTDVAQTVRFRHIFAEK